MPGFVVQVLLVGAGGFVGAVLRHSIGIGLQRLFSTALPIGTLVVNICGCLAIGLVAGAAEARGALSPELRLLVVVGLLGGFTTFSAFGFETHDLLRREPLLALLNVSLHLIVGVAAVWLGLRITS